MGAHGGFGALGLWQGSRQGLRPRPPPGRRRRAARGGPAGPLAAKQRKQSCEHRKGPCRALSSLLKRGGKPVAVVTGPLNGLLGFSSKFCHCSRELAGPLRPGPGRPKPDAAAAGGVPSPWRATARGAGSRRGATAKASALCCTSLCPALPLCPAWSRNRKGCLIPSHSRPKTSR